MTLPTAMLRGHHEELEGEIEDYFERVADLGRVEGNEELLEEFGHFLKHEILTHADAEKEHLYSEINELKEDDSFTATMEVDHDYIERYVHDFERSVEGGDLGEAKRAAARIDGILTPHFEKENDVFLPILDENMTREEVEEEVVGPMHGGDHEGHEEHGHGDHGHEGHEGHEEHGHEGHDH